MLVVLGAYGVAFALLPKDGFWINDNGTKFLQVQAIERNPPLDYSIPWAGESIDPTGRFHPLAPPFGHRIGGKVYAQYSPFFAQVSAPLHRWLGFPGLYLLPLLGGLATLAACRTLAAEMGERGAGAGLAVLLVGLATPLWFYSLTFWEHTPAVALLTWAAVFLLRALRGGGMAAATACGALAGLSVWFRDDGVLLIPAFAAVLARPRAGRPIRLLSFGSAAAAALLPLALFQQATLGSPVGLHGRAYSALGSGLLGYLGGRWEALENLLLRSHPTGWLSLAVGVPALVLLLWRPRIAAQHPWPAVAGPILLGLVTGVVTLLGFLAAPAALPWLRSAAGLFGVAPILILGLPRPSGGEPTGRLPGALGTVILVHLALHLLVVPVPNTVGTHWGCRFLLPYYPWLGTLAAVNLAAWWREGGGERRRWAVPAAVLLALSVALQGVGLGLLGGAKRSRAALNEAVLARPERIVIVTDGTLPQELAPSFYERTIFLARRPEDVEALGELLRSRGVAEALLVQMEPEGGRLRMERLTY